MTGFTVEYSDDMEMVYVIPRDGITFDDLQMLMEYFCESGYKYWLPNEKGGYVLSKNKKEKKNA